MTSIFKTAIITAAALCSLSFAAFAEGAGKYRVEGQNGSNQYKGTVTIVQTGEQSWQIDWVIGDQKYRGYGVGSAKVMAVMYTSGSTTGVSLVAADDKGGYVSIWGNKGDTTLGGETFTPIK